MTRQNCQNHIFSLLSIFKILLRQSSARRRLAVKGREPVHSNVVYTEVGIHKRKQENTLSAKKANKKKTLSIKKKRKKIFFSYLLVFIFKFTPQSMPNNNFPKKNNVSLSLTLNKLFF